MDLPPDSIPAPRRRYLWRVVLGCLVVLLAGAGATAVAVVEQVHTIVQDISVTKPLTVAPRVLAQSSFGQPETLLMVGDDTRSVYKYYTGNVPNLANEMLLVRIDPSKPWISMMSLPRELWVNVTEPSGAVYTNRLNSAYTFGTTTLVKTIKQVTGLSVNHVIATTFTQFEAAINSLGCIYDTIDERYYHNNADGGAQYQNINLLPGYQCLNGSQAEQFVSYRHTDTSQVRDARDQSFLLAVKTQYGPLLANNIGRFERIFGRTVQTDPGLRSASEILNLADLLINAAGLRVRQVPFEASTCYVGQCPAGDLTASPQQIQSSVSNFLNGADVVPKKQVATISHQVAGRAGAAGLGLTPTLDSNVVAERAIAAKLPFTAEFPKVQDLAGTAVPTSQQCQLYTEPCMRSYRIHATDGRFYPIYVEPFSNGDLGQFYDVQGTTWTSLPLLANPQQTIQVGKRTYELFYNGSHLEIVAWRQYGAVYWVHNTLTQAVGNGELLAIAEHTGRIGAVRALPTAPAVKPATVPVPAHGPALVPTPLSPGTPLVESVGRIGGIVTVILLPLGLLLTFRNWRRVRALREYVHAAAMSATVLENRVAAAVPGYAPMPVPAAGGLAAYQFPIPGTGTTPGPAQTFDPAILPDAAEPAQAGRSHRLLFGMAGVATLVLAAAAVAYFAFGHSLFTQAHKQRSQPVPTARVAVLNAGRTLAPARRLALKLADQHVPVVAIGILETAPPSRYEVLYTPGEEKQARVLAQVLKAHHPLVAAVNPATRKTLGPKPKLVVVIP